MTTAPATLTREDLYKGIDEVFERRLAAWRPPGPAPAALPARHPAIVSLAQFVETLKEPLRTGTVIDVSPDGSYRLVDLAQEEALMGTSFAAPIERAGAGLIKGVPLGAIAYGGLFGLLAGEVIDGLVAPRTEKDSPNLANALVKGVAVFAAATMGSKIMGKVALVAFGTVLAIQVLSDWLPIDAWVRKILGLFGKKDDTAPHKQYFPSSQQQLPAGVPAGIPAGVPAQQDELAQVLARDL